MQNLVVCQALIGRLGFLQSSELDKDCVDLLDAFESFVLILHLLDLRNTLLQLCTAPVDGVNFLSDQRLQAMGRSVLCRDVARSCRAAFNVGCQFLQSDVLIVFLCLLLVGLQSSSVCGLDKLGFGGFEFERCLVSLLDFVLEVSSIGRNPNAFDRLSEH